MNSCYPYWFTEHVSFISYSEANEPFPNDNLQLWLAADQGITTKDNSAKGGSKAKRILLSKEL